MGRGKRYCRTYRRKSIMLSDFYSLPESSRIWIYGSEKVLTRKHQDFILDYISDHLQTWNYT